MKTFSNRQVVIANLFYATHFIHFSSIFTIIIQLDPITKSDVEVMKMRPVKFKELHGK
jgi:hypothetical protein